MEIVGTMHIKGLQNFKTQAHILNPADTDIENDKLWNLAAPCKGTAFLYRFIIKSLLFSASITNNTKANFITYNGLNDAKETITRNEDVINLYYVQEI